MIDYSTGKPKKVGVYACRVEGSISDFPEDKFLVWMEKKWWYPWSDQFFRGEVYGWIGPLERRIKE